MPKKKATTISLNGGPEIDLNDKPAVEKLISDAAKGLVQDQTAGYVASIKSQKLTPPSEPHRERYTSQQECVLTQDELLARGHDLAENYAAQTRKEASLASVKSQFKSELEIIAGAISKLAGIVSNGREFREVECFRDWQYTTREVVSVRGDTGEIIERRPMRQDELQMAVPGTEPPEGTTKTIAEAWFPGIVAIHDEDNDNDAEDDGI